MLLFVGFDTGGIGIIGGIGLVTKAQRPEKEKAKQSFRRHVDTKNSDGYDRTPRTSASRSVLTKFAQNKRLGASVPESRLELNREE